MTGGVVPELPRDSAKNRCWSEVHVTGSCFRFPHRCLKRE